jgi:hypothetical protein
MPQPAYDVKKGPFNDIYGLFDPPTINTGTQLSAARITNPDLGKILFYPANVALATKRNGRLLLGIGGNPAFNVVFGTDTADVCDTLNKEGSEVILNYCTQEKLDRILQLEQSGEVVFVNPNDMQLRGIESDRYRSFQIDTE